MPDLFIQFWMFCDWIETEILRAGNRIAGLEVNFVKANSIRILLLLQGSSYPPPDLPGEVTMITVISPGTLLTTEHSAHNAGEGNLELLVGHHLKKTVSILPRNIFNNSHRLLDSVLSWSNLKYYCFIVSYKYEIKTTIRKTINKYTYKILYFSSIK